MCGRFTLKTPEKTIRTLFPDLAVPELSPRFNIAPTQNVVCVRESKANNLEIVSLRWGLVPFWSKDLKIGAKMINARSETAAGKPSFRNAFKKRRCVVLCDGYFEWKKVANEKQPFYITATENDGAFCMAGLWESWNDKATDEKIETCTVLTTAASSTLETIHDRMPVVMGVDERALWLDNEFSDYEKIQSLLKPADEDFFVANPVNKFVNNARNEGPDCVEVVEL